MNMPKGLSSSVKLFFPAHSRDEVLALLRQDVERLRERLPLLRVVLFGSYASDTYTARSDIDLLVVYAGEEQRDAYATVRRTLGLRGLEPHVYTEAQAREMADVLDRMTRDGVAIIDDGSEAPD